MAVKSLLLVALKAIMKLARVYIKRDNLAKSVQKGIMGHSMFEVAFRKAKLSKKDKINYENRK